MAAKRRRRVDHTEDWGQLELLLDWPEQLEYERIRDIVVFGYPVVECAEKTATPERTLYHRVASFDAYGMEGLLPLEVFRGRRISVAMRLRIIELKAEYPPFSLGEIARICYALFGKKPSRRPWGASSRKAPLHSFHRADTPPTIRCLPERSAGRWSWRCTRKGGRPRQPRWGVVIDQEQPSGGRTDAAADAIIATRLPLP